MEEGGHQHDDYVELKVASKWIKDADCVLICAGAGMSIAEGSNVYGSEVDFKSHYPELIPLGYKTSYECMGLFTDPSIPIEIKWGYQIQHLNNMRFRYPSPQQYYDLKELINGKDYFVITSNVDGHFERSGFSKDKIYTPQGDFGYLQCFVPCSRQVYSSKEYVDKVLPHVQNCRITNPTLVPICPNCGGKLFCNVRGGDWFIHDHYNTPQRNFIDWVTSVQSSSKRLVVLEIGAGWNTPIVTRWPMESIVRETPNAVLVRVNPSDYSCPTDITSVGLCNGVDALNMLKTTGDKLSKEEFERAVDAHEKVCVQARHKKDQNPLQDREHPCIDWRKVMRQLTT